MQTAPSGTPGSIGPYQVIRELGRGGMGEVHLARDTRLDRLVAVKALPAHLSQDADRLSRFQREAKVLASLNHPGIGAIYGLEEAHGHRYLILEYVEGETLADRLAKGPIPVGESLAMARQIAEALEAAHEKGIVHRDLKPGNVMVTGDGAVKVLDFGLARAEDSGSASSSAAALADSPTITLPARHSPTIPGAIMGTAGYMSPEQARGKPVDKRSDIFSFGCVLYEMLTGAMPFRGETVADAIGATLHKESDLSLLPAGTPRRVRDLLTNCLAKDRKDRLHDIGDARLELTRAISEPRETGAGAAASPSWWRSGGLLGAACVLAVAAVAVALLLRSQAGHGGATSTGAKVVRATIMPPKGLTYKLGDRSIALSPDGSQVAMCLRPEQDVAVRHLYLRDIARLEFRQLAGTLGAIYPFWSPDGKSIGFFADGKLKRIDLSSGIVRVICDATLGRGASWGSKGTIVFAPSSIGGLWSVSDSGGTPTQITEPTSIDEGHRLPCVLPDGEKFLYFSFGGDVRGVFAFDPSTKSSKLVMASEAEGVYVEPGLLAFQRDNTLMVQPFDPQRLELSGTARPIAPGVHYNWIRQFINLGMNKDGTLVYHPLVPARRFRFEWVSKDGMSTPIGIAPQAMSPLFASLTLAPDGRRAVASVYSDQVRSSLVMLDLERGTQTPIGDPRWFGAIHAHWSESTKSILCLASMGARNGIWSIPLTGNDPPRELLSKSRFDPYPASVTADGKTLIYMLHNREQNVSDVMALSLEKDAQPTAILADPDKREGHPRLSPSGNVMAYIENLGLWGSGTLRVVSFPSISTPVTVSVTESSSSFGWLGENEIAWIDASRKGWSATITLKDGALDAGIPKPLFGGRPLEELAQIVAIDGPRERFLKVVEVERDPEPGLIYVSDWRQDAPDMPTATK